MRSKVYLDTSVVSALFDERTPERLSMTAVLWSKLNDNVLHVSEKAKNLAKIYVKQGIFPEKYFDDALHVALASENQIDILISWNFTHLVKLKTRRMVLAINLQEDFIPVEIISPPEL